MQLFYWKSPAGNFGDDLNLWLWDDLLPGWREWDQGRTLVGVGTVLSAEHLPVENNRYLVVGAGSGFGNLPDVHDNDAWDIGFVRGPNTAKALGLGPKAAITDPAAMAPRLARFSGIAMTDETVVIPHCHTDEDHNYDWPRICGDLGLTHLSPRGDSEAVIRRIAGAKRVITESMHGAIVADAFRVPWQAFSIVPMFNEYKWRDWGASVGLGEFEITPLPAPKHPPPPKPRSFARKVIDKLLRRPRPPVVDRRRTPPLSDDGRATLHDHVAAELRRIVSGEPTLSSDDVLNSRLDMMAERLESIAQRYR